VLTRRSFTPVTLTLFGVFALLSVLVVLNLTLPIDEATLRWIGALRRPWLTEGMLLLTFIGNGLIEFPLALLIAYLLWRLRRPRCSRRFVYTALSAELLYLIAKASFARDRPRVIERLADAGWHSYPSGHSMLAPVIYGFGLILLAESVRSRGARFSLLALAWTLPPLIALSRVYLGVHYPSDVIGALFLGTGWVVLWSESPESRRSRDATSSDPSTR
jgi:undecaprenyl-diphosphatase